MTELRAQGRPVGPPTVTSCPSMVADRRLGGQPPPRRRWGWRRGVMGNWGLDRSMAGRHRPSTLPLRREERRDQRPGIPCPRARRLPRCGWRFPTAPSRGRGAPRGKLHQDAETLHHSKSVLSASLSTTRLGHESHH